MLVHGCIHREHGRLHNYSLCGIFYSPWRTQKGPTAVSVSADTCPTSKSSKLPTPTYLVASCTTGLKHGVHLGHEANAASLHDI